MANSSIAGHLRRSLLIKVISKPTPSRADVNSVIELTSSKIVEALQAQSMTFYLMEGNDITFKNVYYSPSLWNKDPALEKTFRASGEKLLATRLPTGTGVVGKVITSGEPAFFHHAAESATMMASLTATTGFDVRSMLTVPLKTTVVIGAIQVLNKEHSAGTDGQFTEKDLQILQEVAEYSATLLHRMLDPKFQLSAEDTAKFVAKLTDLPLISSADEIEVDEKLVHVLGDAIIRRDGIFPYKRISSTAIAALMTAASRGALSHTTSMAARGAGGSRPMAVPPIAAAIAKRSG